MLPGLQMHSPLYHVRELLFHSEVGSNLNGIILLLQLQQLEREGDLVVRITVLSFAWLSQKTIQKIQNNEAFKLLSSKEWSWRWSDLGLHIIRDNCRSHLTFKSAIQNVMRNSGRFSLSSALEGIAHARQVISLTCHWATGPALVRLSILGPDLC